MRDQLGRGSHRLPIVVSSRSEAGVKAAKRRVFEGSLDAQAERRLSAMQPARCAGYLEPNRLHRVSAERPGLGRSEFATFIGSSPRAVIRERFVDSSSAEVRQLKRRRRPSKNTYFDAKSKRVCGG